MKKHILNLLTIALIIVVLIIVVRCTLAPQFTLAFLNKIA